jgi:hypothetical protein
MGVKRREEGAVEPNRESIQDLMRRYRYEEEAEIAYHLREARNRLANMYRDEAEEEAEAEPRGFPRLRTEIFLQVNVDPHLNALGSLLERRVLARQFPEGWGSRLAPEEE